MHAALHAIIPLIFTMLAAKWYLVPSVLNQVDSLLKVSLPGFIISTTLSLKIIAPNACKLACHYSPSFYHACCKVEPPTLRRRDGVLTMWTAS